jgi:hypothetical protein
MLSTCWVACPFFQGSESLFVVNDRAGCSDAIAYEMEMRVAREITKEQPALRELARCMRSEESSLC